jgi:membrane peptidoglycan carboxypeptidase
MPYLLKMDFRKIVDEDYVNAASLGGLTYGVSTYEMASAYSTLENSGIYRNPTCIVKITDDSGNTVVDNTGDKLPSKRIYEENAADTMTNVLLGVLTKGTGKNYPVEGITCAAKTGTTNNNYDSWFVGYSYYYTTAVWCGYDMPAAMDDGYSITCPGLIWQSYMTYLHKDLQNMEIGTYVPTPGLPGEEVTEEETTAEVETDENGNIIVTETDEYGNVIESVTDVFSPPEEKTTEEVTESSTDEFGNIIEPDTGLYIPGDDENLN